MERFRIGLLVLTAAVIAAPAAAASRAEKAAKKEEKALIAKPIEPMPPRDEKPRAGWSGAYGGLNSGGGFSDRQ